MQVEVLGVNQKLDFKTREVNNVLALRLPSGDSIELVVPDTVAQKVIDAFFKTASSEELGELRVGEHAAPPEALEVEGHLRMPSYAEEEEPVPFVFGEGEKAETNGRGTPSSILPPPPPPATRVTRVARRVDKDEMGYPRMAGAVDASAVTGGENQDEDGVGSV